MRIEGGEHAVDGIFNQLVFFRRRHVLGADALEDVAEDGKLPVGFGSGGVG